MRPLATALIKKQICKAIEDGIRGAFELADAQIRSSRPFSALGTDTNYNRPRTKTVGARKRMSDAESAHASPLEQVKSAFSVPRDSASGAASETSSKVQRRHSRFKVVASRESSLFPSVGHARGWANKAPSPAEDEAVDAPWKSHAYVIFYFTFPGGCGTDERGSVILGLILLLLLLRLMTTNMPRLPSLQLATLLLPPLRPTAQAPLPERND